MTDNVAGAEKLLRAAESAGWILRGKLDPTREQRFFGVGGMEGGHKHDQHRSPVEFHWVTQWEATGLKEQL